MKSLAPLALLAFLAACQPASDRQQAREAGAEAAGTGATVETLPPDESVATPANELANGTAEPTNGL
jgi:hypothetical protein